MRSNDAQTHIELPGIPKVKSGKVREVFDLGDRFLFVASDRISAFDCVMPNGIPQKGRVLNLISAWWFRRLASIVPNHMISHRVEDLPESLHSHADLLRGRAMLVRKAQVLPVECIVRGYLIGSGWKEYSARGTIGDMPLRPGYVMADRLDTPVFTPSTKAESGHDENISYDRTVELVGPALAARLRDTSLALYSAAAEYALTRGIIIADTKFEFGMIGDELTLVDEALTPDSSRFWPADSYRPGSNPPSYDKQFVRDYLETLDWDKTPPAPALPDDVVQHTREKYLEAFERLTGAPLDQALNG
ncbi:MAG: phosphoribosylaminoimidazolesuccinocarboxamide synthase [Kiritimatiellae bacterium]|nr:phosphoribosylaminoimidazolesuccinocarboxamide synthase [Kiritimatiellia bacterium]